MSLDALLVSLVACTSTSSVLHPEQVHLRRTRRRACSGWFDSRNGEQGGRQSRPLRRTTAPLGLEPRLTEPESVVLPITPQGKS